MRRILSAFVIRHFSVFGKCRRSRDPRTVGRKGVFVLNYCHTPTTDRVSMDLSDMRKKYKGDEEVSAIEWTVADMLEDHGNPLFDAQIL